MLRLTELDNRLFHGHLGFQAQLFIGGCHAIQVSPHLLNVFVKLKRGHLRT